MLTMPYGLWVILAVLISYFSGCFGYCLAKVPAYKSGDFVKYGPYRVEVKHIGWSNFHKQWTYYVNCDQWSGYVLVKDLKRCKHK